MAKSNEDIVISGIGGYFPGCKNVGEWKKKLFDNEIHMDEKWSKGKCFLMAKLKSGSLNSA